MLRAAPFIFTLTVLAAVGCAANPSDDSVPPSELPALAARAAAHPDDADVRFRLGVGYYDAGQYPAADSALRAALALDSTDVQARIYLAYVEEARGALDSATADLAAARPSADAATQAAIDDRLALIHREQLVADARAALAAESTLTTLPPEPATIAVLPFRAVGPDTDLIPLGRAVADLVLNDLGKLTELRLLERDRVEALVSEMRLADSGLVDPATAARPGRLLRAERIVQGVVEARDTAAVGLTAGVVRTADGSLAAAATADDPLPQVIAAEQRLVRGIVRGLGITPTPAEDSALRVPATRSYPALLAYGRGLVALDRGDFATADRQFGAAAAADPGFQAAAARAGASARLGRATGVSARRLAGRRRIHRIIRRRRRR